MRGFVVAVGTAGMLGLGCLAGCGPAATPAAPAAPGAAQQAAAPPPVLRLADVALADGQRVAVPWEHPLTFAVADGTIRSVQVTSDAGDVLAGALAAGGSGWQSSGTLFPNSHLAAVVELADERGRHVRQTASLDVADAKARLEATVTPGDGDTVGVGMAVTVVFNRAVPDRAMVQRQLQLSLSNPVEGAWHWFSDKEVHWRPRDFWPTGEQVSLKVPLTHFYAGNGIWGGTDRSADFRVGDANISRVDVAAHTMTVSSNGAVLRTLPMSAGSDKYPTMGGVHRVLEKEQKVTMDSATVGIPRNAPDGYFEDVFFDVRISNSGAFVHAAPWSVGAQGNRNVSHGCVNLAPADAQWYFGLARRGDVVDVVNSPRAASPSDAGTEDWSESWDAWLAGSALH